MTTTPGIAQHTHSMSVTAVLHGIMQEPDIRAVLLPGVCTTAHEDMTPMQQLNSRMCAFLRLLSGMQVWYNRHIEVDHNDIEKEVQAAADKGDFYGNWHLSGMQHMKRYLQKVMADGGQVGGRVRHKLKGDLQSNNFGSGKDVRSSLSFHVLHPSS